MKITPRQLRQIIREAIAASAAEEFPPASAGELSLNDPEAINISDEGVDEDGREWERRGEWPVVREPGSPPPPSRRERERARTSTRPTPTSRPIVDPRTVGAAYVSGPAPGEPFDPGRHRGEFPALPEEELEPEEESEEETLGESSMTLTAVQLKRLIRRKLREIATEESVPEEIQRQIDKLDQSGIHAVAQWDDEAGKWKVVETQ